MLIKNSSDTSETQYSPEDSMWNMRGTVATMLAKTLISSPHPNSGDTERSSGKGQ